MKRREITKKILLGVCSKPQTKSRNFNTPTNRRAIEFCFDFRYYFFCFRSFFLSCYHFYTVLHRISISHQPSTNMCALCTICISQKKKKNIDTYTIYMYIFAFESVLDSPLILLQRPPKFNSNRVLLGFFSCCVHLCIPHENQYQ